MGIIKEQISGTEIFVEIQSSNLKSAKYDTKDQVLTITFNSGNIYEYYDFPHSEFARFRIVESQGKFLNTNINGRYKYKKITS